MHCKPDTNYKVIHDPSHVTDGVVQTKVFKTALRLHYSLLTIATSY